jgi:hypothetical protein
MRTHPLRLEVGQEIVPAVWLGGVDCACNESFFEEHDIRFVLTLGANMPPRFPEKAEYLVLDTVADSLDQDLLPLLPRCVDFIAQARRQKRVVLIHCFAGVSRSASVVIAYLMAAAAEGLTMREALALVKRRRPFVDPNEGFLTQLEKWEQTCRRPPPGIWTPLFFSLRQPGEAVSMMLAQPLLLGVFVLTIISLAVAFCTIVLS